MFCKSRSLTEISQSEWTANTHDDVFEVTDFSFQIGEVRNHEPSNYVRACRDFQEEIEREGFFKTNYSWYIMKTGISYLLLAITILLFIEGRNVQNKWIQVEQTLFTNRYYLKMSFSILKIV